ncbi:MAG: hypothetical protein MZV64_71070 [Ignavibacteriales bacterium]|nr:hypothetical protein [Ignavibacteriales bacterium]
MRQVGGFGGFSRDDLHFAFRLRAQHESSCSMITDTPCSSFGSPAAISVLVLASTDHADRRFCGSAIGIVAHQRSGRGSSQTFGRIR